MPLNWKSKILLAKIETVYGVSANPLAADAILATEISLSPMEGSDVSRDLEQPFMSADGTIPTELHAKLSFKVELVGSGTAGTAPGWGVLMRACAMAEVKTVGTSVVYNPVSTAHESVTLHLWIDSTRYALLGAKGNCKLMVTAQGIPYLEFAFTGLWTLPAETARIVPVLTGFQKPEVASKAKTPVCTLGGIAFVTRSLSLDFGNQVENRFLIGAEAVLITDKAETVEMRVEAVPLTTWNPFSKAANQDAVALVLTHGTVGGKIATLSVPAMQLQRPQGLENSQNVKEWPLRGVPLPVAGNDQFTLSLT